MAALNQLAGECGIEPQANTLIQTLFIRGLLNPERKRILLTGEFPQNDLLLQKANKLSTNDRPIQAEQRLRQRPKKPYRACGRFHAVLKRACLARDTVCTKCDRKGHFARHCQSRIK